MSLSSCCSCIQYRVTITNGKRHKYIFCFILIASPQCGGLFLNHTILKVGAGLAGRLRGHRVEAFHEADGTACALATTLQEAVVHDRDGRRARGHGGQVGQGVVARFH